MAVSPQSGIIPSGLILLKSKTLDYHLQHVRRAAGRQRQPAPHLIFLEGQKTKSDKYGV